MNRHHVLHGVLLVLLWAAASLLIGLWLFANSSRTVVLATHDTELRPTFDGYVTLHTGPIIPDLRLESGSELGVDATLGKTDAPSVPELIRRYAYIGSQPDGQVATVTRAVEDMALSAALRGAAFGLLPVLVWLAIGPARRHDLLSRAGSPAGIASALVVVLVVVLVWQPWEGTDPRDEDEEQQLTWVTLPEYLGPGVPVPEQAAALEVGSDVTTTSSRRLIESAIDTYDKSKVFYDRAAVAAADLELHEPSREETVVVLVSDRHDNIGMDRVARAVGDTAGATAVFDAGDDTSTGQRWEAFSLDSLNEAFEDLERYAVAGNHDHGDFVTDYLADLGWTMLDGEVVEGPGGSTLLGVDDPRSSGLGNWRDESGFSFSEVGERLSDAACESEERVSTILVHDANLARDALDRGCVDLVVGGHLHVQQGPLRVIGENDEAGYIYTTGTTGGAAYAIAIGSKPRREATVTLLTYRDGRPVGLQGVVLQTNGAFEVQDYRTLVLNE